MIAVGTDDAAFARQTRTHRQKLDGDRQTMLVHAAGGHALDIASKNDAAIRPLDGQTTHQIVAFAQVGEILGVGFRPGQIPVHRQFRPLGIRLHGHHIDQPHDVSVAGMAHQNRTIGRGIPADEDRGARNGAGHAPVRRSDHDQQNENCCQSAMDATHSHAPFASVGP